MVGSGLQKAVEGNGDGKQANCNGRRVCGVSCKGTLSGAADGLNKVGFQGLKEAQELQGFSSKVAHLCSGPLEGSKVLKSKEACGVGHLTKKAHLPVLCVAQSGGEGSVNVHCSSDSKNSPSEKPTLLGASCFSRGHYFQNRKLSPPVELHSSTDMALMEEAARHPGSFSFSVSSLGTRAASSPSFCGTGLGSEGCGVVFAVDSLGEDNSPLRMVSENDSSLEFEEAGVIPIEVAVGEKDKEEGSCLGLVSREEVPMENCCSSYLEAFSDWLGMPTVDLEAEILALLRKMEARKKVREREDGKREKNSSSSKSERELKKLGVLCKGSEGKR
ncbi:hypothetical protein PVL29_005214 [Vitis rotundifolia]|uniref:Uncharacterized protein n=1 Tax=Vitis rotundifolia TaxID=103349 RepID=A0AA39AAD9_VITRO|nr:hypothetical protein PVL29_005214 [Vitis rotundifolia]